MNLDASGNRRTFFTCEIRKFARGNLVGGARRIKCNRRRAHPAQGRVELVI